MQTKLRPQKFWAALLYSTQTHCAYSQKIPPVLNMFCMKKCLLILSYLIFFDQGKRSCPGASRVCKKCLKYKIYAHKGSNSNTFYYRWVTMQCNVVKSLPIQMRATILYLANLWMDFKTANRFGGVFVTSSSLNL